MDDVDEQRVGALLAKAAASCRPSNAQVSTFVPATASAVLSPLALVVCLAAPLGAALQPPATDLPVSLDRIREELSHTPPTRLKLDMPVPAPVARFKTRVDQQVFVLTFEEWLEKELKLGVLQRQSADWAAKCCAISLDLLFKSIANELQRRKERKIREQIARELAELEAARKKAGPPDER